MAPRRDSVLVTPISAPKEIEELSDTVGSAPITPRRESSEDDASFSAVEAAARARARASSAFHRSVDAQAVLDPSLASTTAPAQILLQQQEQQQEQEEQQEQVEQEQEQMEQDNKQKQLEKETFEQNESGHSNNEQQDEAARVVSGRFFDDLLQDLDELDFEEAASKRESGAVGDMAGFDALGAEFDAELEIDERSIAKQKLQTMFDLIDDEEEARAESNY